MATRLFALLIGIDKYKSGNIWDLEACVDDAQSMRRWLTQDLHVPREHICLLADAQATKRAIEDKFMDHLVNNPVIEKDDAIVIYFAGHGGSIPSPRGWYNDGMKDVEVLCPYDHDSKAPEGRVAGISDRSFHAMLRDLADIKGNNITVILDCCFSPTDARNRRNVRYTPTMKAMPDDLYSGLWRSALAGSTSADLYRGFARRDGDTHVLFAAARPGECASAGKGGGLFTHALLSVKDSEPLHALPCTEFLELVEERMEGHKPVVVGRNKERLLFDGIPFQTDPRLVSIDMHDYDNLRIDAGAIHGIVEGTEFSLHAHNYMGSLNPTLASYVATEVHPTWCLARTKSQSKPRAFQGWARVTRWNNRVPFRVHLRRSLFSIFRRCRLRRTLPLQTSSTSSINQSRTGVNIVRVRNAAHADVSVTLRKREMLVERHDSMIAANCRRIIHLPSSDSGADLRTIESAARFHLHLHRKNPERPMLGLVTMELYRLDPTTWTRVSGNLLVDGRAQIVDDDKNSVYSVVLHNYSDHDLWPYLVSMDSAGYSISMVYHPDPSDPRPPLRKHSHMVIGSGTLDSEALSFSLGDDVSAGAGFLKLFVSSVFTPMSFIEQGVTVPTPSHAAREKTGASSAANELWDTVVACVNVVRRAAI
ncbi:uncharacterized protein PHACADRAFT_258508 [Phanerochaete carnosa HHB-10118-sp]|uniref:Peptidase C14 caspase domain-containing protein n=1 Tax=Phanerochaete carnosa (strain HHB-10118-sp) TaxID=650164 RepID=K5UWW3_PHACS|nr:uncharacterized protein PHACADRAFT_258508 [Phanerochaete carnosa HHB-10118-sp]EKM54566.1 hypothetical protein PHACADRAFT_258508 [Phanerochaete carnosa HHB-10118-sp]